MCLRLYSLIARILYNSSFTRELYLVVRIYPILYREVLRRGRHQGAAVLVLVSKHL